MIKILKECEIDKTVKILKYLQYGLYLQKIASLKNVYSHIFNDICKFLYLKWIIALML